MENGYVNVNGQDVFVPDTPGPVIDYLQFVLDNVGGYYTSEREYNPSQYSDSATPLTSLNFLGHESKWGQIYDGNRIADSYRADYDNRDIQIHGSNPEFVYGRRGNGEFEAVNQGNEETFHEAGTYIPNLSDVQARITELIKSGTLSGSTSTNVYFPNEARNTAEPREAFADTFAAYILEPDVLKGTKRGEFFDDRMRTWLCEMLKETFR